MDEIMVLAAALGVPPVSLLIPTGDAATVELLPGRVWPIDLARRWVDGTEGIEIHVPHHRDTAVTEGIPASKPASLKALELARRHDVLIEQVDAWTVHLDAAARARLVRGVASADLALRVEEAMAEVEQVAARYEADRQDATAFMAWDEGKKRLDVLLRRQGEERVLLDAVKAVRALRQEIRDRGEIPPPLPSALAWVDEGVSPDAP